jgi:hypothetical protein
MNSGFDWSVTTEAWVPVSRYDYSYTINHMLASSTYYRYYEATQEWGKESKFAYSYDINDRLTSMEYYSLYSKDSIALSYKHVWIYDEQGNLKQYETYDKDYRYVGDVYTSYIALDNTEYYFYRHIVLSSVAGATQSRNYSVCPNPVSGDFRIKGVSDGALVQLYDMNGRIQTITRIHGDNPISVGSLPKGMYVLKVSTASGPVILKMEKK